MSTTEKQDDPSLSQTEAVDASRASSVIWVDRLRWPLALVGSIALLSLTAFFVLDRSHTAVQSSYKETIAIAKDLTTKADEIARKFRHGTITKTFVASLPSIKRSGSGRLELTTLESTERFRTEDKLRIWWDYVSLGTTVSEISVPVTYRYHLKLDDSWSLSVSNQTCLVTAPKIRPTIPPSIDTGQMQKSTQNGWARFNADDQLEELEKSLTSSLVQYADDESRMALVREEARKTVAGFVKNWLLKEDQWREDRFHSVVVRFSDEPEEQSSIETVSFLNRD
jgi:hypothetical protein